MPKAAEMQDFKDENAGFCRINLQSYFGNLVNEMCIIN